MMACAATRQCQALVGASSPLSNNTKLASAQRRVAGDDDPNRGRFDARTRCHERNQGYVGHSTSPAPRSRATGRPSKPSITPAAAITSKGGGPTRDGVENEGTGARNSR